LTNDVIAVSRGLFLREQPAYALMLIKEIEEDRVKGLFTVAASDLKADTEAQASARKTLEADITGGIARGYGLVLINSGAAGLCLAIADRLNAHRTLLLRQSDDLMAETGLVPTMVPSTAESAFLGVQRHQCGAVYERAEDLKALIEGLRKNSVGYRISLIWNTAEQVEETEAALAREREREEKRLLEEQRRRQEQEERDRHRKADKEKTKEQRQKQLQQQNEKTASAAAAEIANDVQIALERSGSRGDATVLQYPAFFHWHGELLRDRWEQLSFKSDLVDYGLSDFKGRSLQTAFSRVAIRLRNRILGEYKDACYILGRINDHEFRVHREPFEAPCDDVGALGRWKRAHGFRSQWLVE
jgi:hypothetical protein